MPERKSRERLVQSDDHVQTGSTCASVLDTGRGTRPLWRWRSHSLVGSSLGAPSYLPQPSGWREIKCSLPDPLHWGKRKEISLWEMWGRAWLEREAIQVLVRTVSRKDQSHYTLRKFWNHNPPYLKKKEKGPERKPHPRMDTHHPTLHPTHFLLQSLLVKESLASKGRIWNLLSSFPGGNHFPKVQWKPDSATVQEDSNDGVNTPERNEVFCFT